MLLLLLLLLNPCKNAGIQEGIHSLAFTRLGSIDGGEQDTKERGMLIFILTDMSSRHLIPVLTKSSSLKNEKTAIHSCDQMMSDCISMLVQNLFWLAGSNPSVWHHHTSAFNSTTFIFNIKLASASKLTYFCIIPEWAFHLLPKLIQYERRRGLEKEVALTNREEAANAFRNHSTQTDWCYSKDFHILSEEIRWDIEIKHSMQRVRSELRVRICRWREHKSQSLPYSEE